MRTLAPQMSRTGGRCFNSLAYEPAGEDDVVVVEGAGFEVVVVVARLDVVLDAGGGTVSGDVHGSAVVTGGAGLLGTGYLERRADPSDGRARLVCLTPQGRRFVRRALQEIGRIETDCQTRLRTGGCQDFRASLESAISNAEAARSQQ